LDEASPLFGLNMEEHPANKIFVFTLSIDAVQELTKSTVNVQTEYAIEDVLIGHSFVNTESVDTVSPLGRRHWRAAAAAATGTATGTGTGTANGATSATTDQQERNGKTTSKNVVPATSRRIISDYGKISETEPYPVWYPAKAGSYAKSKF
jgi:hypothetical protein